MASQAPFCDNPKCQETRELLADLCGRIAISSLVEDDDLEEYALDILDRLVGYCSPERRL